MVRRERGDPSNERLEFLGDSVLGLVVTDHIYLTYPDLPEGEFAEVRASVVNAQALAEVALELDLGAAVRLGKGEDASGGREKPSILADAFEAVIACHLPRRRLGGGVASSCCACSATVIAEAAAGPGGQDYKTRLQELAAQHYPTCRATSSRTKGPTTPRRSSPRVFIGADQQGEGEGRSKKQAEQAAARSAWESLRRLA